MQTHTRRNASKSLTVAMLAVLTVLGGHAAAQANPSSDAHVTRCDLFSHGMTIGHGSIARTRTNRDGRLCTEIRLKMDTRVNLLLYKFTMTMDETWVMAANELIAYTWDSTENGKHKTIAGALRDGTFRFEINEDGKTRVWSAPRSAYDLTSIGLPEKPLKPGEAITLRVLDPCEGLVEERLYRGTGAETLMVGKRSSACETVAIDYAGNHLKRWQIADEFGPLILREDGDLKRGSYSRCASGL